MDQAPGPRRFLRRTAGALLLFLVQACLGERGAPPPPPQALEAFIGADDIQVSAAGPGVAYYRFLDTDQPWAAHFLRVDLKRCELGLAVLEAPVGSVDQAGRARVSELLRASGREVLAAVNGDFFSPEGLPLGTEVVGGDVHRVRGRPALAWSPERGLWMGLPTAHGDSLLSLGWTIPRPEGDGETQVVGGFPLLLQDGNRVGDLEVADRPSFAAERHPRTAVGFDVDDGVLWIVVVDGRQPDYSAGMTLPELTEVMEILGAEDAINLDGGGSTVMVVQGETVSRPSDPEGERPVVNALGVLRDPALCTPLSDQASRDLPPNSPRASTFPRTPTRIPPI